VSGHTELADDQHVERKMEDAGKFVPDGDASARQGQNHAVLPSGKVREFEGQQFARLPSIAEASHGRPLPPAA